MAIRDWFRSIKRRNAARGNDPIKHIVVLMFENHSFDQMLGCFQEIYPKLAGVDPKNPRFNQDSTGRKYYQQRSDDPIVDPDPKHELEHILNHLKDGNSGFVSEYERVYADALPEQRQKIMDYFGRGDLPAMHALAENFTICDHWFSSVPGPTWTNRFFVHSGTSKGRVHMPEGAMSNPLLYLGYDQDTIYDRLNEKDIFWRVYYGDVPQSLVLSHQREGKNTSYYVGLDRFFEDAKLPEPEFPQYSFIEPKYFHFPFGDPQNDDHPPHSTIPAQALLGSIYNALRTNEPLWQSTLLIVLYDEHGGFFDHVVPPTAIVPDANLEDWTFDSHGLRVPALLISPWVEKGVVSTIFDHTSVLKYLSEKWELQPLTKRVESTNSIGSAIRKAGIPRKDTPLSVPVPQLPMMAAAEEAAEDFVEPLNEHQRALLEFTELLEQQTVAESGGFGAMRGPEVGTEGQIAKQRVEDFIAMKKSSPE